MSSVPLLRITVDYTVIGIPHPGLQVTIRVLERELRQLSRGVEVILVEDLVPDQRARIVALDAVSHRVLVEFC